MLFRGQPGVSVLFMEEMWSRLAWAGIFLVQPLSGIYGPIATPPGWHQPIAWCLPSAPVFEGMRSVLFDGAFRTDLLPHALALNRAWMALAVVVFPLLLRSARDHGLPLQVAV